MLDDGARKLAYENLPTKTYSSPNAFPSSLRSKRALVQNKLDAGEAAKGRDPVVSLVLDHGLVGGLLADQKTVCRAFFFFFFFGRPKKNVKSVVISVLVTRRCSFGLQMKEVQSFTRCVFFFLQGLKKKERWGEGDKMMTFS